MGPAPKPVCLPHSAAPELPGPCRSSSWLSLAGYGQVTLESPPAVGAASTGAALARPWGGGYGAGAEAAWVKTVSSSSGRGTVSSMAIWAITAHFRGRVGQPDT